MSKKSGVGFPILPWTITWGPHARGWRPGSDTCPLSSTLRPVQDPWLKLSPPDPNHLFPRSGIPADLWAPYLGLGTGQRCWQGGAAGVDPHDTTARGLLVAAFNAGKLGDPTEWTGQPNEQELHLMSVSAAAYAHLRQLAGVPQEPPAPPPQPPPVDPPVPPAEPPVPPVPPGPSGLERRVAELEDEAAELLSAIQLQQAQVVSLQQTAAAQRADHEGFVAAAKRRVETLEAWRLDFIQHVNAELQEDRDRLAALEAGSPPAPPQPPPPEPPPGDAPDFTWRLEAPWESTEGEPHQLLKVPFSGVARRIALSYLVEIPQVATGKRQQVHAAYVDGSGKGGILSLLFVDGGRRSWVLRTNSAGAEQPWVTATKAGLRPEVAVTNAYLVRQDWMPGDNRVRAGSAGEATDRPLLALRMREGLSIDLGYPAASVNGNPAEAYSLGWRWSELVVNIWA